MDSVNKKCYGLYQRAKANPNGLRFTELKYLCECLGLSCDRVRGSHFIYKRDVPFFLISVQKMRDGMAKPYQVRQLLSYIGDNNLADWSE